MKSIVKDFIEYTGISENLPIHPHSFKSLNLQETLTMSSNKPNIKELVKVMIDTNIVETRVIKTPKATSLEGNILTGWNLIVEGELKLKIGYIEDSDKEEIHFSNFSLPFSTNIVLPEYFKASNSVNVDGYIESVSAKRLNKREIFHNTIIFLNAVIYR